MMKDPTDASERWLREYAENGYGKSVTEFNTRYGFGKTAHSRWMSTIEGFKDRYQDIKKAHALRSKADAEKPHLLPPSHHENLPIKQQNFFESFRRTKKVLEAAKKSGMTIREIREARENDEAFRQAYLDTAYEIDLYIQDVLMDQALGGNVSAINKLYTIRNSEATSSEDDVEWWEDMAGVAGAFK